MTRKERHQLMNEMIKELPQETVELFIDYLNLYAKDLLEESEALEGIEEAKDSIKIFQSMASGVTACSVDLKIKIKRGIYLDPDKRKDI